MLDVGACLSAIEYLVAVTYLIQLLGDRGQVLPFLPDKKKLRACAAALPPPFTEEGKLFALLGRERRRFCSVLCLWVFEPVSHREYISHYTAASRAMSVSCPFIFVNDVSLFKSLIKYFLDTEMRRSAHT